MAFSATDEIVSKLFARSPPVLEPGDKVYDTSLVEKIANLREHQFTIAALHIANDDIHHAHLIAQSSEGDSTADLLHATLHRREGDYWNSQYWYRHIAAHPLVPSLTDAKEFVNACEASAKKQSADQDTTEMELRRKQWEQLKALVEWTRTNCDRPAQ